MTIQTVKLLDSGYLVNGNMSVPEAEGNRHYQMILDWINDGNQPEGADIIEPDYVALRTGPEGYAPTGEQLGMIADGIQAAHVAEVKARFPKTITGGVTIGEVPQELLDAAADKLFTAQLAEYKAAILRLEQYIVADGREEVTEMQPTREVIFNEDTMEMDNVMEEVIVQSAIEPAEPTVEQTVYSDDIDTEPTVETVANPLIVQDVLEREAAQAVVDATPDELKTEV
jgi:hypothetical protein